MLREISSDIELGKVETSKLTKTVDESQWLVYIKTAAILRPQQLLTITYIESTLLISPNSCMQAFLISDLNFLLVLDLYSDQLIFLPRQETQSLSL